MSIKSTLNYLLIVSVFFTFIFSSCNPEQDEILTKKENSTSSNDLLLEKKSVMTLEAKYDYYCKVISLLVLEAMKDDDFKAFLKSEAAKEFDGDYDILLASTLDKKVKEHISLKDYFQQLFKKINAKRSNYIDQNFLEKAVKDFPLLQISIPEIYEKSTENWNTKEEGFYVVLHPFHLNESKDKFIEAYNESGEKQLLSLDNPPQKTAIVIGRNERMKAVSAVEAARLKDNPYYTNNDYAYFFTSSTKSSFSDGNSIERIDDDYDRDLFNTSDVLEKGKFVSRSAYRQVESWPDGRPEFKVIIVYTERNSLTGQISANSVEKVISEDGWITRYGLWVQLSTKHMNIPIITWYKDRHGLSMKYRWIEQDSGTSTELTTTLNNSYDDGTSANTSVTTTVKDDDDDAGEAIVQYEDPTQQGGTQYNTGILTFNIIQ